MIHDFCRFICFLFSKAVLRVGVKGRENIPKKGGFILAANHVSNLDPEVIGANCPRRLSYMAKQELFSNRFLSWFMYKLGAFPVRRDTGDIRALREAIRRVKKGRGLLLFPEGTRSQDGRISDKAEAGIGFLVAKLNVPVIPVFVKGTEEAFPKGAKFIRPARASVTFGEQIKIEGNLSYARIAQLILEDIKRLSEGAVSNKASQNS